MHQAHFLFTSQDSRLQLEIRPPGYVSSFLLTAHAGNLQHERLRTVPESVRDSGVMLLLLLDPDTGLFCCMRVRVAVNTLNLLALYDSGALKPLKDASAAAPRCLQACRAGGHGRDEGRSRRGGSLRMGGMIFKRFLVMRLMQLCRTMEDECRQIQRREPAEDALLAMKKHVLTVVHRSVKNNCCVSFQHDRDLCRSFKKLSHESAAVYLSVKVLVSKVFLCFYQEIKYKHSSQ